MKEREKALAELLDEFNGRYLALQRQYPNTEQSMINVWVGLGDKPIHFTPGVPTEDGWYVVKCKDYYTVVYMQEFDRYLLDKGTILSHAKLPEL